MTGDEVGRTIARSASWISRVEAGLMGIRKVELQRLLDVYEIHDAAARERLERLATGRQQQGWWSKYRSATPEPYAMLIGLENEAAAIRSYENLAFPGLMQAREYAEAIFRDSAQNWTEQEVRDRTEVRMHRQAILRKATAPRLSVIIPESVLNRSVGGHDVMTRQLDRICQVAGLPTVELLVVPAAQAIPIASVVGFEVLDFPSHLPIAYVENPSGGAIVDGRDVAIYERYFERLRRLAVGTEESLELIQRARARLD